MKLNLKLPIKDLEGKDIPNAFMHKMLAPVLAGPGTKDILKLFDWAVALFRTGVIDVDRQDLEIIKAIVENDQGMTILTKAQILTEITKVK